MFKNSCFSYGFFGFRRGQEPEQDLGPRPRPSARGVGASTGARFSRLRALKINKNLSQLIIIIIIIIIIIMTMMMIMMMPRIDAILNTLQIGYKISQQSNLGPIWAQLRANWPQLGTKFWALLN